MKPEAFGQSVEQLFAAGVTVYPIHPKAAERYRQRQAPSGVKDDQLDAWSLADALRLDGHLWRALALMDPIVAELQLLCRDEIALIGQRTAFVNQLKQALHECYPAALEAFDNWISPSAWDFVLTFPTPAQLQQAGRRRWEKFLHGHKLLNPSRPQPRENPVSYPSAIFHRRAEVLRRWVDSGSVRGWRWTAWLKHSPEILPRADPNPDDVFPVALAHGPVTAAEAHRPKVAGAVQLLETEARMVGIGHE
ncbi:MAG: transposase [Verrucomicrobia bacterium]|nr:transposase [Verrucomicrobiota bacterium]